MYFSSMEANVAIHNLPEGRKKQIKHEPISKFLRKYCGNLKFSASGFDACELSDIGQEFHFNNTHSEFEA
ncbi:hypothetical protein V6N13_112161 [Hibiscus sabdariffa]|uniref:Uncharacterized protein n=1 Tax=Hibiscus sabdariffa TaxID=183260 RepID=A0ABR2TNA5_9ROSI